MTPIANDVVFENELRWLDCIFHWCVAVPAQGVSNVFALAHMMQRAIECIFAWCISKLICVRLSSCFVDSVVLFVDWLVWGVQKLPLCKFCRWCQRSSVD